MPPRMIQKMRSKNRNTLRCTCPGRLIKCTCATKVSQSCGYSFRLYSFERRRQQRRRAAALAHPGHVQTQEMFVPLNAVARSALGPQVALAALAAMSP